MKRLLIFLVFSGFCFAGISVDWSLPVISEKPIVIPHSKITVDGVLTSDEWGKCPGFPVRSKNHIANATRQWSGPMDAGMEFYVSWNESGLFFGAIVADNQVINEKSPENAYEQDCIEIFVDGRSSERFMKPPYSKGCYQILVVPPVDGKNPVATVFGVHKIQDLEIAGKKTEFGYNIELFVPWSAFPDIRKPGPGVNIGIQAMLDDYDKKDLDKVQPLSLSYSGKKELYRSPQNFIHCICEERAEPFLSIECPSVILEKKPFPVSIETSSLAGEITAIKIRMENQDGKILDERKPKIKKYSSPWTNALRVNFTLDGKKIEGDSFFISVVATGKGAEVVYKKQVFFLGNVTDEILSEILKADIKKLSQQDPFRASGYLAVGVCYEKIKRAVETDDKERLAAAVREAAGRIEVLNNRKFKQTSSLIDFLVLTDEPESQVVIEYPAIDTASITFYWGSVPLANVRVKQFSSEDQAKEAARQKMDGFIDLLEDVNPAGPVIIGGFPARASSWNYQVFYFNIEKFDPEKQVMVVLPQKKQIYVVDIEKIDYVDVGSVVMLDAGENIKNRLQKYIQGLKKKPVIGSLDDALKGGPFLVVSNKVSEPLTSFRAYKVNVVKQSVVRVPYKNMLVSCSHPSRWVAEEAVKLVLKKIPVSIQDVEKIRKTLVNEFAFSTKSSEKVKTQNFTYCGDLHAHSNFSDGYLSPVGMVLSSMYCYMDFFALTDHNTIEGAKIVSQLLSKHGFGYTFIIGQEITTKDFHFNAYPLNKTIPWDGSAEEIINLAKQQSAIIQWNHPGWTNSQWELSRLDQPLKNTGLDAWEHIPLYYYQWKKQGILPALVGTTDTHDGTFSNSERTIILSSELSEKSLVEAIKNRKSILVSSSNGSDYMYGETDFMGETWDILREGNSLKEAKRDYIRNMLKNADLPGLLQEKYQKSQAGR
ncbi:MAG: CehA/McbA family metallohydrolase [bacterium]|nr:CehA/McbA family metallohydrolase [bacterium]